MKIFIVFAFFTFVSGKAFDSAVDGEDIILTTRMPNLDENTFNRAIGGCTFKEFTYSVQPCQVAFFMSFRTNKARPCSIRFKTFSACYLRQVKRCFAKVLSDGALDEVINRYQNSFGAFKKVQCGEADYKVSHWFPDFPRSDECPKGTMGNLDKCVQQWYQVFRKDPGSNKLCLKYHYSTRCMKEVIGKCSFDFSKSSWIFSKDFNPFCDRMQRKQLREK